MNRNSVEQLIKQRIDVLEDAKRQYELGIGECSIKIDELNFILSEIEAQAKLATKAIVHTQIKENSLKAVLSDETDARRANIFLEFMEKCGDESVYMTARKKMPRLETALYRKNRLWANWKAFKEDFHRWVNREGPWANILPKQ